jgi:hypothetical protein
MKKKYSGRELLVMVFRSSKFKVQKFFHSKSKEVGVEIMAESLLLIADI